MGTPKPKTTGRGRVPRARNLGPFNSDATDACSVSRRGPLDGQRLVTSPSRSLGRKTQTGNCSVFAQGASSGARRSRLPPRRLPGPKPARVPRAREGPAPCTNHFTGKARGQRSRGLVTPLVTWGVGTDHGAQLWQPRAQAIRAEAGPQRGGSSTWRGTERGHRKTSSFHFINTYPGLHWYPPQGPAKWVRVHPYFTWGN